MVTEEPNISDNSRLNTTAAAKVLGIDRTTLYRACKVGAIRFDIARNGRRYYIGRHIKSTGKKIFEFSRQTKSYAWGFVLNMKPLLYVPKEKHIFAKSNLTDKISYSCACWS